MPAGDRASLIPRASRTSGVRKKYGANRGKQRKASVCQGLYCGRPWVIIAVVVFDNCVFRQVRPDTPIIGQQGTGCNM